MILTPHNPIITPRCRTCGGFTREWQRANRRRAGFAGWLHGACSCCPNAYRLVHRCLGGTTNYVIFDSPVGPNVAFMYAGDCLFSNSGAARYNAIEVSNLGLEVIELPGTTRSACPECIICMCDDDYFYNPSNLAFQVTINSWTWNTSCSCIPWSPQPWFCRRLSGGGPGAGYSPPPDMSSLFGTYLLSLSSGQSNKCFWEHGELVGFGGLWYMGGANTEPGCSFPESDDGQGSVLGYADFLHFGLWYGASPFSSSPGFNAVISVHDDPENPINGPLVFNLDSSICLLEAGEHAMSQTFGDDVAAAGVTISRVTL
jgi:hypothetical protein